MNPSHLISTKFTPPRSGRHAVTREPLLTRLQEARACRLVVINGGAGYGKTTLLAQWRQWLMTEGEQVAWLSLSPDDNSLETFCASLAGALQAAGVVRDGDMLLLGESAAGHQLASALLSNALTGQVNELYLMLDDYQHAASAPVDALLQALIDNLPQNVHLVLASRAMPNLLLGRLHAMGTLCQVNASDLAFDFRESHDFLRAHLDPAIDIDCAHALHDQADGWPIGLQLLSLSRKSNPRRPPLAAALRPGPGLEAYLAEDVLADLPPELLGFLGRIAILRRFNAPLAAHLTGRADAEELIQVIETRNLFFQRIDVPGDYQWFRLHRMFADYLALRLQASGEDVRALHGRAAEWFENAGLTAEAMRHALLTEDFERVVLLLERIQPSSKSVSHLSQFMRWLDRLPLERLARHPALLLMGIWGCVLTLRTAKAEAWMGSLGTLPDESDWAAQLLLIRASIAMQRDEMGQCVALLEELGEAPLGNEFLEQVRASLAIGGLASPGHFAQARRYLNSPLAATLRNSHHEMALIGQTSAVLAARTEGNVLVAERMAIPILDQAQARHGRRSVSACSCAALLADVLYEQGRLEEARELLANRLDILRFAVPEYRFSAARTHARLLHALESPRSALEFLREQQEHFRDLGLERGVALMLAEQIRVVIAVDDWRYAEALQASLEDLRAEQREPSSRLAEISLLAAVGEARIALARNQPELALRVLRDVQTGIDEYGRGQWRVQLLVLQARALGQLGRDIEMREAMCGALAVGYRLGLSRSFVDEGEVVRRLVATLDEFSDPTLQAYRLALAGEAPAEASPGATAGAVGGSVPGFALTRREEEILALLEQSMSNKRIALTLDLSLQTVKWNLKNIFVKLGVGSRYDAIVIARKRAPSRN